MKMLIELDVSLGGKIARMEEIAKSGKLCNSVARNHYEREMNLPHAIELAFDDFIEKYGKAGGDHTCILDEIKDARAAREKEMQIFPPYKNMRDGKAGGDICKYCGSTTHTTREHEEADEQLPERLAWLKTRKEAGEQ